MPRDDRARLLVPQVLDSDSADPCRLVPLRFLPAGTTEFAPFRPFLFVKSAARRMIQGLLLVGVVPRAAERPGESMTRQHQDLMIHVTGCRPRRPSLEDQGGFPAANTLTRSHRLFKRAGIPNPPKLFVNRRASLVSDWAGQHGGHVAAKWAGHSAQIALQRYALVRPKTSRVQQD